MSGGLTTTGVTVSAGERRSVAQVQIGWLTLTPPDSGE
jgi:hypothetical protein